MYAAWERQKNNVTFSSGWTFAGHFCADELADPTDVHCLPREGVESRRGLSRGSPTLSSCSAGAVRRRRKTRGGVRTEAVPERGLPSYSVPLGSAPEAGRTPNWLRQRGTAGGDCAGHLGSLPSIFLGGGGEPWRRWEAPQLAARPPQGATVGKVARVARMAACHLLSRQVKVVCRNAHASQGFGCVCQASRSYCADVVFRFPYENSAVPYEVLTLQMHDLILILRVIS